MWWVANAAGAGRSRREAPPGGPAIAAAAAMAALIKGGLRGVTGAEREPRSRSIWTPFYGEISLILTKLPATHFRLSRVRTVIVLLLET